MAQNRTPRRIALVGAGGSSGKTTSAVNIGAKLAQLGYRVRLIDADGQGDCSQYCGYMDPAWTLGDAIAGEAVYPDDTESSGWRAPTLTEIEQPVGRSSEEEAKEHGGLYSSRHETAAWLARMTLIPSGEGPTGLRLPAAVVRLEQNKMAGEVFRRALSVLNSGDPPDVEIWDLHGTVGWLTYHVLAWVDSAITAVTPDDKSVGRHLDELSGIIDEVDEFRHAPGEPRVLDLDAIIPVRTRPKRDGQYYQTVIEEIRAHERYGPKTTPPIREAVVVPESFAACEPLPLYVPNDGVTQDHSSVVDDLKERGIIG